METTAVKLYSTGYREAKTYLAAALFVAGNIVLPQICHLVPQGGLRWLPIYFFTLVGAYKYGWHFFFYIFIYTSNCTFIYIFFYIIKIITIIIFYISNLNNTRNKIYIKVF